MDTEFELNKAGWFEVQNIEEIDGFDPDQYGNIWHNVKFTGDAGTFMWLAKNKPEEGKKYYGHLEPTKTGKRLRFKTDKVPDDEPKPSNANQPKYQDKSKDITLGMVWKIVAQIRGLPENDEEFAKFFEIVDSHLTELVMMSEKLKEE